MDIKTIQELLTNHSSKLSNIFVLGEKNVGKTQFVKKFSNFTKFNHSILKLNLNDNDIYSYETGKKNIEHVNIIEIKNIQFFQDYQNLLKNNKNNTILILYENLKSTKDYVTKIAELSTEHGIFTKLFLVRTKCELNYQKSSNSDEQFSRSLGKYNNSKI